MSPTREEQIEALERFGLTNTDHGARVVEARVLEVDELLHATFVYGFVRVAGRSRRRPPVSRLLVLRHNPESTPPWIRVAFFDGAALATLERATRGAIGFHEARAAQGAGR